MLPTFLLGLEGAGDEADVSDTLPAAHDDDDGDFVEYGDLPAIAVAIGGDLFALLLLLLVAIFLAESAPGE